MTRIEIQDDDFWIDGAPTYAGRVWRGLRVEGLLLNARMVQATFDDLNPATRQRWAYPDTGQWNAERNLREFLAMLPVYRRHGLLAVTLNLQGGSPEGYSREQPWENSGFAPDGSLRAAYADRLRRAIQAADSQSMAVIVGYFYQGQDERLEDEAAVVRAVDAATDLLLEGGWRNVLVEINNECNTHYEHSILQPPRVHELIERVQRRSGGQLLTSTSYGGRGRVPDQAVVRQADFLLLHGNGTADPELIVDQVNRTRALAGYRGQPILFNEDDHFDFDQPRNNWLAAVSRHASWGYFDPGAGVSGRAAAGDYVHGYQLVPVNWRINTPRKRQFFNLLAAMTGATTESWPHAVAGERSTMELRNWAGNIRFSTDRVHHPETVGQVQEIVRNSRQVRVLGSRHSFNAIVDSSGDLISLDRLEPVLEVDAQRRQITIDGGVTYGRLAPQVHEAGFALHNTASLPHITVAGACATATHGSGSRNGILGSPVAAMEIVTADGAVQTISRADDGARFGGAVVGLGGLGVVTRLTLDVSPTFDMYQVVYENLPQAQVEEHFDAIMSSGYSVSLFSDWRESRFNQAWIKTAAVSGEASPPAPTFYGATLATTDVHPLPTLDPATCTPQMGVVGPWHERLPHFRAEFEPSYGEELQSEYFVPRARARAALRAIAGIRGDVAPLLQMSEVRTIAADDLWMSPFYRRDCVALHFTWRYDCEGVKLLLPHIEERLAPFDARPHWGKLFTIPASTLQARYKRLPDFRALLEYFDPRGTFRNPFLEAFVFG